MNIMGASVVMMIGWLLISLLCKGYIADLLFKDEEDITDGRN